MHGVRDKKMSSDGHRTFFSDSFPAPLCSIVLSHRVQFKLPLVPLVMKSIVNDTLLPKRALLWLRSPPVQVCVLYCCYVLLQTPTSGHQYAYAGSPLSSPCSPVCTAWTYVRHLLLWFHLLDVIVLMSVWISAPLFHQSSPFQFDLTQW